MTPLVRELEKLVSPGSDVSFDELLDLMSSIYYNSAVSDPEQDQSSGPKATDLIMMALKLALDQKKRGPGSLVQVPDVRKLINLSKEAFDAAALKLRDSG